MSTQAINKDFAINFSKALKSITKSTKDIAIYNSVFFAHSVVFKKFKYYYNYYVAKPKNIAHIESPMLTLFIFIYNDNHLLINDRVNIIEKPNIKFI